MKMAANHRKNSSLHLKKATAFHRFEWFIEPKRAAELCHRSLSTVKKWIQDGHIDPACQKLLEILCFGLLPWKQWEGITVHEDGLTLKDGRFMSIKELEIWSLHMAIKSDLEQQNAALVKELNETKKGQCCH